MKVLQINCVYGVGSTGKIVRDIHHGIIDRGHSSVVCYGRGLKAQESFVYKTCSEFFAKLNNAFSRFTGIMYGGCRISTNRLIRFIEDERPDVVHLHCINGYFVNIYKLVEWLKLNEFKTVLTLHSEFMYTANCGYSLDCDRYLRGCGNCPRLRKETKSLLFDRTSTSFLMMKEAFDGFSPWLRVVSVSSWLKRRAEQSPILAKMCHDVVLNGVDTDIFYPRSKAFTQGESLLQNEKVIFHVTSMFSDEPGHIKGGAYVLRLAELMKGRPIKFVVAGKVDLIAPIPSNIVLLGEVADQIELAEYYSASDLTLITSEKETFSMPCAESLCCGTPIVGFKAGAPETIALAEYSEFVPHGDIDALESCVTKWLNRSFDSLEVSNLARSVYSKERMVEGYLDLYQDILCG